tara:strand:- start:236 stop:391 length:156 start_codon:yes stop_codon:yes gene_type:complete
MTNTSRKDTIKLLKELKKEINKLAKLKINEASEQIKVYTETLEAEKRRRGQ